MISWYGSRATEGIEYLHALATQARAPLNRDNLITSRSLSAPRAWAKLIGSPRYYPHLRPSV